MIQDSLKLTGKKRLRWDSRQLPTLAPDEVLIETITTSVSIGAELPQYEANDLTDPTPDYPRKVGYESYGVVIKTGIDVTSLHVGDRVLAFYGQQSYGVVSAHKAFYVPAEIDDKSALLAILSCDAAKGVRKLNPSPSDSVIVAGMGTMGLLAVYYLKAFYGVAKVDAIELDPGRRELAKSFGVGVVYTPNEVEFDCYDYGIECSARNVAFALLQQAVKPGRSICVLSDGNKETLVLQPEFYEKELQIMGSSDGWDYPEHFQWYFESVQRAEYVKQIFDMEIQRDDLIQTFSELSERIINPLKIVVAYPQTEN
ncbi:alcohol dehydrogenase [Exiguobacterium sp. SH31]|uniref:zinc-dependent alcohol dehydrogenase n=1 Tax=unclassified Exiguobacterium TaxID=2644629 RepID=UPI0008AD0051|nr:MULTISPECIES: zinc-binding alcohol dehydrogenase [unclassified Exiguobacterium]OGX80341.1 alcohol dehydrogenase [Exiguobacterium sp. SH31]TCI72989.1 zinc-binding alcohol dehydrogenase [Exiguobacterium sp. SH0S7]